MWAFDLSPSSSELGVRLSLQSQGFSENEIQQHINSPEFTSKNSIGFYTRIFKKVIWSVLFFSVLLLFFKIKFASVFLFISIILNFNISISLFPFLSLISSYIMVPYRAVFICISNLFLVYLLMKIIKNLTVATEQKPNHAIKQMGESTSVE
jgi:hypothetical protein